MKRLLILLLMVMPLLSACGGGDKKPEDEADKIDKKKPLPICPQVAIVHELDTFRDYGTEKPDRSQLVAVSRMEKIDGDCSYQKEGIDVAFDLSLVAQRGPRLGGKRDEFPFFIAVLGPDHKVIDKNRMSTLFKFGDDTKIIDKTEHLHVFLPMRYKDWDTGPKYQVLLGFQLTEAQLEAVRARAVKAVPEIKSATKPDADAKVGGETSGHGSDKNADGDKLPEASTAPEDVKPHGVVKDPDALKEGHILRLPDNYKPSEDDKTSSDGPTVDPAPGFGRSAPSGPAKPAP